jgi:hypothetical protein
MTSDNRDLYYDVAELFANRSIDDKAGGFAKIIRLHYGLVTESIWISDSGFDQSWVAIAAVKNGEDSAAIRAKRELEAVLDEASGVPGRCRVFFPPLALTPEQETAFRLGGVHAFLHLLRP